jgi:hypothetical protein
VIGTSGDPVIEKARATPFTAEGAKDAEKKLIGKAKAHRGDAEARRKPLSPQIYADRRRSGKAKFTTD